MPRFKSQPRSRLPTKLETFSDHPNLKEMQLCKGCRKMYFNTGWELIQFNMLLGWGWEMIKDETEALC